MRSTYLESDVTLLLKDVTGLVEPQPAAERERLIQAGKHYCEMLPIEYIPTAQYMQTYREALKNDARSTADAVGAVSDKIIAKRGRRVVLVSLARAGTPIGILIKRYIKWKYQTDVPHYSISIIRGKGIDENAINYILNRHDAKQILFVDGWIGKGAILEELKKAVRPYPGLSAQLAVLADPADTTSLYGTREDILIPSSCLNSTVSGLISRTFLRDDIIGADDFHGAVYYEAWKKEDLTYDFIRKIESGFRLEPEAKEAGQIVLRQSGMEEVRRIAAEFSIDNINLIKPGIGEATRVLLRRVPWKVLIGEQYQKDTSLNHIRRLAEERGVPVEAYPLEHYKVCGLIKKMADI